MSPTGFDQDLDALNAWIKQLPIGFSSVLLAERAKNGKTDFRVAVQHFSEVAEPIIVSALTKRRNTDRLFLLAVFGAIAFGISFVVMLA